MITFIGDFTCKKDGNNGRIILPSAFKKAMLAKDESRFVAKADPDEPCVVLTPYAQWEQEMAFVRSKINKHNREQKKFYRHYFRGIAEVVMDGNGRLNLPKKMMEEFGNGKELVLVGVDSVIEIWAKDQFEASAVSEGELADWEERFLGRDGGEIE